MKSNLKCAHASEASTKILIKHKHIKLRLSADIQAKER